MSKYRSNGVNIIQEEEITIKDAKSLLKRKKDELEIFENRVSRIREEVRNLEEVLKDE